MTVAVDRAAERAEGAAISLVDGDIHPQPSNVKALGKHMSERWRRHHETFGPRGPGGAYYPRANEHAARTDSWPPSGLPPGSDLDFLRAQLLDAWSIDIGVLNALGPAAGLQRNLEYGAALASAMNDWLQEEWLDPEPRLRASMIVPGEDGRLAAAEIRRRAGQAGFVQVLLHVRSAEPLGRRKYWPMFEAAVEQGLPIGLHFGGAGGGPITGAGWPSFYIEDHAGMPVVFESQVTSLVLEGVFEHFPSLKIVLIEGGFGWLAPLMWRLDNAYRWLREEVPHLSRLPSEYVREHFWLTTQPMEEPAQSRHFPQLLAQLGMNDRLMFATDYPHWDFDAPDQAIPTRLDPDLERDIMAGNACRLYRL